MKIKYGLISCDSHGQVDRDAFTKRMSKEKFGDRIPHLIETKERAHMAWPSEGPVHRWLVNDMVVDIRSPTNCPALWDDPLRLNGPQRWEEVPRAAYDPVAEWQQTSDRYIPMALIPHLTDIETTVAEVERVAKMGFRGILMVAEPSVAVKAADTFKIGGSNPALKGLKHFCDPYWEPLWAACQDLQLPIHWHGNGGLGLPMPMWKEYDQGQMRSAITAPAFSILGQFLPNLVLSGILDRYPRLHWVCAETGIGWLNYVLEACDHEWERHHLWTQGIVTRPSELFRRQVHVSFWFEYRGVESRHKLGLDNIMWQSDFPHNVSTYPDSWKFVDQRLSGVPEAERKKLLYGNAVQLYRLE